MSHPDTWQHQLFTMRRYRLRFSRILPITILAATFIYLSIQFYPTTSHVLPILIASYYGPIECSCVRPELPTRPHDNLTDTPSSLCSIYATRRGPHQRIIAISLFGPEENSLFQLNKSLPFLHKLIRDMNKIYPDNFTLRVYHDNTVNVTDLICPIECKHPNVDFCNMKTKRFIPPKIWRFIPAGDPLVDISRYRRERWHFENNGWCSWNIGNHTFLILVMSRDLSSALTLRERAAVDAWLSSKKSFHAMRDHPFHGVPMLGGMWGFRPSMDPTLSHMIRDKIHNPELVRKYSGTGDQTFLSQEVWPHAKASAIVHDSFLCRHDFGQKSQPFPTQRPSANQTNCFVGCVRPCCGKGTMPFGECPKQCRPPNHPEWIYC